MFAKVGTGMLWNLFSLILLLLRLASLTHENPQRRKIVLGMRPVGCKDQPILICVFVEISHSCNFCDSYYGC